MTKKLGAIAGVIIILLLGVWWFNSQNHIKNDPLPPIERMVDKRDPKTIAGSYWTKSLDCTYKNPPQERILLMKTFDCKTTTHNVKVLTTWQQYFTPRSTADDEPPYCLVPQPASTGMIRAAKDRKRIYCEETARDYMKKIFS